MNKKMIDVIMNPVRQRIIQYLILNQKGSVNEISKELFDIPRPSLYRHIRLLLETNIIEIIEEKAIRGTVKKIYGLVKHSPDEFSRKDISLLIQNSLISILSSFVRYFEQEDSDPMKDMLSLSTSTLLLSDEEYLDMMKRIGQIYNEVIYNKPQENRKPRCITIISSPPNNDNKGE